MLSVVRFLSFNLVSVVFLDNLIRYFFAIFENHIAIFVHSLFGIISFMASTSESVQSGRTNCRKWTRIRFTVIDNGTIESIAWEGFLYSLHVWLTRYDSYHMSHNTKIDREAWTFVAFLTSAAIIWSHIDAKSVRITIVSDVTTFIDIDTFITFRLVTSIA